MLLLPCAAARCDAALVRRVVGKQSPLAFHLDLRYAINLSVAEAPEASGTGLAGLGPILGEAPQPIEDEMAVWRWPY